ncbi:MarR family transcriptional regulator [Roseixanthobacter pseudopolyaromaticivorans]|uniref:MarR family transcriptional regulator n=1 Tax=Xanthobacteraceae TaxID=335928 RepID=UPI00372C97A0
MTGTKQGLGEDDKAYLAVLSDILERLNEIHPDMTVRTARVLLQIADVEPILQADLIRRYGYVKTTLNRIIYLLTDRGARGAGDGLKLVLKESGDNDRDKPLRLSPLGRRLIHDMIDTIKKAGK